jgi:hypothetical protein
MWLVPLLVLAWITKINLNKWQMGPCSLQLCLVEGRHNQHAAAPPGARVPRPSNGSRGGHQGGRWEEQTKMRRGVENGSVWWRGIWTLKGICGPHIHVLLSAVKEESWIDWRDWKVRSTANSTLRVDNPRWVCLAEPSWDSCVRYVVCLSKRADRWVPCSELIPDRLCLIASPSVHCCSLPPSPHPPPCTLEVEPPPCTLEAELCWLPAPLPCAATTHGGRSHRKSCRRERGGLAWRQTNCHCAGGLSMREG